MNQVDVDSYCHGAFNLWESQTLHKTQPQNRTIIEKIMECPGRKFGERSNLDWVIREGFSGEVPLRVSPEG